MKCTAVFLSLVPPALLLLSHSRVASAFVLRPTPLSVSTTRLQAVGLEPEPEGGEEMVALQTVPDCRMKKMKALPDIKSDQGDAYEFWMTAVADSNLVKEIRTQILKDASKKANFPGFRKV